LGCTPACTSGGGTVTWNIGLLPKGTCNQVVKWWGAVTTIPCNPLGPKEYFAVVPDIRILVEKEILLSMSTAVERE